MVSYYKYETEKRALNTLFLLFYLKIKENSFPFSA